MHTTTRDSSKIKFDFLPDWASPKEVQVFLGLSRSTTYELIRCGHIPSRKFGRLLRIPKEALRPTVTRNGAK